MAIWHQIVILGAILVTCDDGATEKVILHQVGNDSYCEGDTVMLKCTVHTRDVLNWRCADNETRLLHCSSRDILPLNCPNTTLHPRKPLCNLTSDGITSIVDIKVSLNSSMLTCEDGRDSSVYKTITMPVPVPPVQVFKQSDQIKGTPEINFRRVNISWQEITTEQQQKYSITVKPGVEGCNTTCERDHPYAELKVAIDTRYSMTVTTVVCNGSRQSAASEAFPIHLKVPSPVSSCNVASSDEGSIEVQWSSLNESSHLYYILTYDLDGIITVVKVPPEDCCFYIITNNSARHISVMGENNVGPGEKTTCNHSSSWNKALLATLLIVILILFLISLPLVVTYAVRRCQQRNKEVQEETQAQETDEDLEPSSAQYSFDSVKAAFEASQHETAEYPIKMEAGRSVLYKKVMYFAAYGVDRIYCYCVDTMEWTSIKKKMRYLNPGLAIIDGDVATIGGVKKRKPTNEVWAWSKKRWIAHKKMKVKLSDPAVVMSPGYTYVVVISGNTCIDVEAHWTSSVQVYNVKQKSWKFVSKLPSPRAGTEVTLCNRKVYVFTDRYSKGYKSSLKDLISSNEDERVWQDIKSFPLTFSTPTTVNGHVVCVGGGNDDGYGLDEIHIYDEETDAWSKIDKSLLKRRMYSMVEVCDKLVVVVGGINRLTNERNIADRVTQVEIFTLD